MVPDLQKLLLTSDELSDIDEVTSLIKEVNLSHRKFIKKVLRARPTKAPEPSRDGRSSYVQQFKLPKTDMPVFDKLWRRFWERFTQRLSIYPDIPPTEKIAQLEQCIKPPDRRALIIAPSETEEEYLASVESLKERYDQPNLIYRTHVHDAFQYQTPKTRKGLYELSTHMKEAWYL